MREKVMFYFIFVFIVISTAFAGSIAQITVMENTYFPEGIVRLGDISEINAGNPDLRKKLEEVVITQAPAAGQHVRVSRSMLVSRISRTGIEPDEYVLNSPRNIKIFSAVMTVSSNDLIKKATEYLRSVDRWRTGMKPEASKKPEALKVPAGKLSFECSSSEVDGYLVVNINVIVDGKKELSGSVYFQQPHASTAGESNPANVGNTSPEKVTRNGEIVVRAGAPLKIKLIRKNLAIEVFGKATTSGSIGERIRVKINNQDKYYDAIIQDANSAVIEI